MQRVQVQLDNIDCCSVTTATCYPCGPECLGGCVAYVRGMRHMHTELGTARCVTRSDEAMSAFSSPSIDGEYKV